ncbi:Hypothetical predicted protein, partial [Prunus dulcis]
VNKLEFVTTIRDAFMPIPNMNWASQREPNNKASTLKEVDDLKRPNTSPKTSYPRLRMPIEKRRLTRPVNTHAVGLKDNVWTKLPTTRSGLNCN